MKYAKVVIFSLFLSIPLLIVPTHGLYKDFGWHVLWIVPLIAIVAWAVAIPLLIKSDKKSIQKRNEI